MRGLKGSEIGLKFSAKVPCLAFSERPFYGVFMVSFWALLRPVFEAPRWVRCAIYLGAFCGHLWLQRTANLSLL